MGLVSSRQHRRLDRARLERCTLEELQPALSVALERLAGGHREFTTTGSPGLLQHGSEALLDLLSGSFLVEAQRVTLHDRARPHRRNRRGRVVYELHGECSSSGVVRVYLRTAVRRNPVALLTYVHTLLHEWVHHYDFSAFGCSVHCSGFYARLGQLYVPARARLRGDSPARGSAASPGA